MKKLSYEDDNDDDDGDKDADENVMTQEYETLIKIYHHFATYYYLLFLLEHITQCTSQEQIDDFDAQSTM